MVYRIYGLQIDSEISLPELDCSADQTSQLIDTAIRFRERSDDRCASKEIFSWVLPSGKLWLSCKKDDSTYRLQFPELADFSIDLNGREIVCVLGPKTPPETIRHLLLDQVLPLILSIKGKDALHATAVLTSAGVCAFTGATGTGKSTVAASFLQAGYPSLSDDCLVLENDGGRILAQPAYAGVRLWEDSLEAIFGSDHRCFPVAHYTSKKRLILDRSFDALSANSSPLVRIYSLVQSVEHESSVDFAEPVLEKLSRRDAFTELIACTFLFDVTDRGILMRQFRFLDSLASSVSVRRLRIPPSFSSLPKVRELIASDIENAVL